VYKRGNKYVAQVTVGYEKCGDGIMRRKTRPKTFDKRKDAVAALAKLSAEPRREIPTLRQLYDRWLPSHQAGKSTLDCYKAAYKYFRDIELMRIDGITIEDCEKVSRAMSDRLDETDPIPYQYLLEVSSPGLDRLLRLPEHFENAIGEAVEVHLYAPIEKKKQWEGVLEAATDTTVTLAFEDAPSMVFEKEKISSVRVIPDLDW
jgi:ribosome maturation factor RimP